MQIRYRLLVFILLDLVAQQELLVELAQKEELHFLVQYQPKAEAADKLEEALAQEVRGPTAQEVLIIVFVPYQDQEPLQYLAQDLYIAETRHIREDMLVAEAVLQAPIIMEKAAAELMELHHQDLAQVA
jgi:hypothetical protein